MSKKLIKSAANENGRGRMPRPSLTPPPDLFPSLREIPVSQKIRTNEDLLPPHRFMESDFVSEKLRLKPEISEDFMEEYSEENPHPSHRFMGSDILAEKLPLKSEEDFADDLLTSHARDAMLKDLIKLADNLDNLGLTKEANLLDRCISKVASDEVEEEEDTNYERMMEEQNAGSLPNLDRYSDEEIRGFAQRSRQHRQDFFANMPTSKDERVEYYGKKLAELAKDRESQSVGVGIDVSMVLSQFHNLALGYDPDRISKYPQFKDWTPEDYGRAIKIFKHHLHNGK